MNLIGKAPRIGRAYYWRSCKQLFEFGDTLKWKRQLQNSMPVTDTEYYNIMKEFDKEREGVPYGSEKYTKLRNLYYKKMLITYKSSIMNKIVETGGNFTDYLRFYLIVVPEVNDCHLLINILNYNKLRYKAVGSLFNNVFRWRILLRKVFSLSFWALNI